MNIRSVSFAPLRESRNGEDVEMQGTSLATLVQLTDLHLRADTDAIVYGHHAQMRFEAALERVQAESADAIVITGDVADDGQQLATNVLPT